MKRIFGFIFILAIAGCGSRTETPPSQMTGIQVVDTDFSKGRLGLRHEITLGDLERFHGHLCDGLVVGYQALGQAFKVLYPDGAVDRTNTRIVSKASPCLTDAAVYLTGGRYQFNTFYVSNEIAGLFVVQRKDTGQTVLVEMKPGIKPPEIDTLGKLAVQGKLPACDLDKLKSLEDDFSHFLLETPPEQNFRVVALNDFKWTPVLRNDFTKTDILNKNKPVCK
ncbi:MAG: hypothetical protein D6714_18760 [Bacteroidetes bacterium]|nr:MAG: hypothetical protein D6714_18760 [Bacteroidota bacterium]